MGDTLLAFGGQRYPMPRVLTAAKVASVVCADKGHNIQSLKSGEYPDVNLKVVLTKYEILCTQCGKPLSLLLQKVPSKRPSGKKEP